MVQKLFLLKLESDLDPKPEKFCEHGPGFKSLVEGKKEQLKIYIYIHYISVSGLFLKVL